MAVQGLHHYNISAPLSLIEDVRDFYVRVLGFTDGARPRFASTGYWLYAGGAPIVHLTARTTDSDADRDGPGAPGYFDHLALACTGLDAMLQRLVELDIPFEIDEVPQLSQVQIFLNDPAGLGLELNFTGER